MARIPLKTLGEKPSGGPRVPDKPSVVNLADLADDILLFDTMASRTKYARARQQLPARNCDVEVPEPTAGLASRLFMTWLTPLVRLGFDRPLDAADMYQVDASMSAERNEARFVECWAAERDRAAAKAATVTAATVAKPPSFLRAMWTAYGTEWLWSGVFLVVNIVASMVSPLVFEELMAYLTRYEDAHRGGFAHAAADHGDDHGARGYLLALALFLLQVVAVLSNSAYFVQTRRLGIRVRGAVTASVFRKTQRLAAHTRAQFDTGLIQNVASTDAARLELAVPYLHMAWSLPVQLVVVLALLVRLVGAGALAAFALMVAFIPVQSRVLRFLTRYRRANQAFADARVRSLAETIGAIRVVKLLAWDEIRRDAVLGLRDQEMVYIRRLALWRAALNAISKMVPTLAALVVFAYVYAVGGALSVPILYPALACLNLLKLPLFYFPTMVPLLIDARVAVNRVTALLTADELAPRAKPVRVAPSGTATPHIQLTDAEFRWNAPESDATTPLTLSGITLSIPRGALVIVVGSVNSGKSSFLSALLGEMRHTRGEFIVSEPTSTSEPIGPARPFAAYCSQQSVLMNVSIRANVTFGLPYDAARYRAALRAAALDKDLEQLPGSDTVEVGEQGSTLSGGQQSRVALARAIYADADLVLLDDILAACDMRVAAALFHGAIVTALKGKTRVLVTHAVHLARHADLVVAMQGGRVAEVGTYDELAKRSGGVLAQMLGASATVSSEVTTPSPQEEEFESSSSSSTPSPTPCRRRSTASVVSTTLAKTKKPSGPLIAAEDRVKGSVSWSVYRSYLRASGGTLTGLGVVLGVVLAQAARTGGDIWLSLWSSGGIAALAGDGGGAYLGIYASFAAAQILALLGNGAHIAVAGVRASRTLHASAVERLLRAPMAFFDTQPAGRIINRMSRDQDALDAALPEAVRQLAGSLGNTVASLAVMVGATPLFAVPLVPLLAVYAHVQQRYLRTSRELRRIEAMARSPLLAHLGESLGGGSGGGGAVGAKKGKKQKKKGGDGKTSSDSTSGGGVVGGAAAATIRAYGQTTAFARAHMRLIDLSSSPSFLQFAAQRWLAIRLELLGAVMVLLAAVFGVLGVTVLSQAGPRDLGVSAAVVGLSLSYALQVTGALTWTVRMATDGETQLSSVERILAYCEQVPVERPSVDVPAEQVVPAEWPQHGEIEFRDVTLAYRPGLEPAMRRMSVKIPAGAKVGIVGRTGSGKSTLLAALFRLAEPSSGSIEIDGVDTADVPLLELRRRIAVIPQQPQLFTGSVRSNLDPLGEVDDARLWDCLDQTGLKPQVEAHEARLDAPLSVVGLSVGTAQLMCLARAMVHEARILVMDEASAAVDNETDALIQSVVRSRNFARATVLTVAHRLNTIMDSDYILFMDAGRVREFAPPRDLLARGDSAFAALVDETGPENAAVLRRMVVA
ncbi:hypothetical protein H9P43_005628 [Blastocladiella emersonii ATCC 22665]|nr:hypothetical protein H9P43_005628 [Blastocladiella emersonii ATCC 22665]